jgi:hypothetical protein
MLSAANDHDVSGFNVDGDHTIIVDKLHLAGSRPQKVRLVSVIDMPRPKVLELVSRCGRVHGDLAARLTLVLVQGESEETVGNVVLGCRMEFHPEICKPAVTVEGRYVCHMHSVPHTRCGRAPCR